MEADILNILSSGQLARLIPTVSDSKKEERATSSLLASFMVVPDFAKEVLSEIGAPSAKKIKVECYTEVTFKSSGKDSKIRPDGLIIVRAGSKKWMALVESKVGNADLTAEQIEGYLDLAKSNQIDALITISNQFATSPTHHPVKVSKTKTRSVSLFHFSWLSIVSKAILITDSNSLNDPEQAYILSELIRYMNHESSGVTSLNKMHSDWKAVCEKVQQGASLDKKSQITKNAVTSWQQLTKHLALNLSMKIGEPVSISLPRARSQDADFNFSEDCSTLESQNSLISYFEIPNAASKIEFSADFLRRTINVSMKLDAPKDKSRATASINWLTRQLKPTSIRGVSIRVYWPKRTPMTTGTVEDALEKPESLIPSGVKDMPTHLELIRVVDVMSRFKGAKTFVEESSKHFPGFYQDVGQHLSKWVAKAPKVKDAKPSENVVPTVLSSGSGMSIAASESTIDSIGNGVSQRFGVFEKFLDENKESE